MRHLTALLTATIILTGCNTDASGEDCFRWSIEADNATTEAERDRWLDRLYDGGCL